jgi:hypothetical protein
MIVYYNFESKLPDDPLKLFHIVKCFIVIIDYEA